MKDESQGIVRLEFEREGIAVVSLCQPARLNIVDLLVRDRLMEVFTAISDNAAIRAVILRADGQHFCAGADITEFGSAPSVFEARRIRWDRDPWYLLYSLPQPVVVAMHGYALGSGMEMAMMCDIRLGSPDTMLGLPETKLGMLPAAGGTRSITTVVSPAVALPIVLSGEPVDSSSALRLGLLHEVAEDVEARARQVAVQLVGLPTAAAQAAKQATRNAMDVQLQQGLAQERVLARLTAVATRS